MDGNTLVDYTDETGTTTYTFTATDLEGNTVSTTTDEDDVVIEVAITDSDGEDLNVISELEVDEGTAVYIYDDGTMTAVDDDGA